jgi:Ca2+-binding RTX toxin-like protein
MFSRIYGGAHAARLASSRKQARRRLSLESLEERKVMAYASSLVVNADAFTEYVSGQQYSLFDASLNIDDVTEPVHVSITLYEDDGDLSFDETGFFDDADQAVTEGGDAVVIFAEDYTTVGSVNIGDNPNDLLFVAPNVTTPGDYWVVISASIPGQNVHTQFGMPIHVVPGASDQQPVVGAVSGPTSGVPGQELHYSVTASDPEGATVSYAWSVLRQGNGQEVATGDDANFTFVAPDSDTYVVNVTVSDGTSVPAASSSPAIVGITSTSVNAGVLSVGANAGGSSFTITNGGNINVNGQPFSGVNQIVVYGQGGNDVVLVSNSVTVPVWIFGGAGNDVITGGGGVNVIVGGAGTDTLLGAAGRDLLIGGEGTDIITGGAADDIVIGGFTAYDADAAALDAIMSLWTNTSLTFGQRTASLRTNWLKAHNANAANNTVFDDNAIDLLVGGSGNDWFFANLVADSPGDVLDLIVGATTGEAARYQEVKDSL